MLKQDIIKLESVQHKFTKRLKVLEIFHTKLCLDSLHCRRTKADLLMCYNVLSIITHAVSLTFSLLFLQPL